MFAHMSNKWRTDQIGRFGLGFKSVLGVTDNPEFYSRSGSFYFDRSEAGKLINPINPDASTYPVLRTAFPITSPVESVDPILRSLAHWSNNIVRLPLKAKAYDGLLDKINNFPPEFLLFVDHVKVLMFDTEETDLVLSLYKEGAYHFLSKGDKKGVWRVFGFFHELSDEALEDNPEPYKQEKAKVTWAVPLGRIRNPGYFWAFFPTETASLVSGILNAPWQTHSDRRNLLDGIYNKDIINAAVGMIGDALPELSTDEDPARHLDALPRQPRPDDTDLAKYLCHQLMMELIDHRIVPDQNGRFQRVNDLKYPPRSVGRDAIDMWSTCRTRPLDWLHNTASHRLAIIDRIVALDKTWRKEAPDSTISGWLEALVDNVNPGLEDKAVHASMIAIQTAALIPEDQRRHEYIGKIVLSANNKWRSMDPSNIFLNGNESGSSGSHLVHPKLEADPQTLEALKQLGLNYISPTKAFQKTVEMLFESKQWEALWKQSRDGYSMLWVKIVKRMHNRFRPLHVRNIVGNWRPITNVLLPGPIVPSDGSRDQAIAVDVVYHRDDITVLKKLGLVDSPEVEHSYLRESDVAGYKWECYHKYLQELPSTIRTKPKEYYMEFVNHKATGPLIMIKDLSKEGTARYTEALLDIDAIYDKWTMRHQTRFDYYPDRPYDSLAVETLRKHGCIRLPYGIVKLSDGLGGNPVNPDVRRWLLEHHNSIQIREAFGIEIEPDVDLIDEMLPLPLIDEWPGLRSHLPSEYWNVDIVRCEQVGFDSSGYELECHFKGNSIYLRNRADENQEFRAVLRELGLSLTDEEIDHILLRITSEDVAMEIERIRNMSTDAERLLAAVGEMSLQDGLPDSLHRYWQEEGIEVSGLEVAEAAIATFDVGALREYRYYLEHLDPPKQWAGRRPAVDFVRSLGFGVEWAGQGKKRRSQYEEVAGPYSLPDLHDYQRFIADNVRHLLSLGELDGKRGLISLPTGSGKTRVAVQAIVEAIREEEYSGSVLWVADRDELCEQAVESWRQIWPNVGVESVSLKISRLWGNQKNPTPVNGPHVIVASVQTLDNRIVKYRRDREFLDDCRLVVFDEAHRSIARTYTGVLEALGLTRSQKRDKSFLIGLTATPYRGHSEEETSRLVNRYGRNRLDTGAFLSDDPEFVTRELQSTGVLAQADHKMIEGGDFSLTIAELAEMIEKRMPWLPKRIEKEIGADTNRTRRILDAYNQHIRDRGWPTLIFATSVDHSKALAALLNQSGVVARPVDGTTHPSTRRKIVEDFRSGKIEALVNYAVFREGFDAPKTRAIVVARPVYSPNLYFQMIGRGLRGPLNGGNERCLILNVWDNIENYEEKLAFTELEWLWANG